MKRQIEERLRFEELLADISGRFVAVPDDRLDSEIEAAQQLVCECLGLDICSLWQRTQSEPGSLILTHKYVPPDFPAVPELWNARDIFPWTLDKISKGETVCLSRMIDAPVEAACDVETWQYLGVKSALVFPLYAGARGVFGVLTFDTIRDEWIWPSKIVKRLRLVSNIFATALSHKMDSEALRDSWEQVSLAVDSAEAGVWSLDLKTGAIWATAKARDFHGFSPDEVITLDKYRKSIHPDDLERVNSIVERQIQEHTDLRVEFRVVLPDHSIRWIKARAKEYYGPSGDLEHVSGVSLDISERKLAEVERVQMRLELAHLSRVTMMNEMSSSLAHEINQPLGAILNNASAAKRMMSRGKNSPEYIGEILDDIINDAKRAGDVVRKIRGLVKKNEVHFEQLNINVLILNAVELVRNNLILNKISIHLDLQPDIENVTGDRVHLQQVIVNLISNAVEAMEGMPTKELNIRTSMTAPDTVKVSMTDSGTGIDSKTEEKLFQPFFTTKKDGLGMGLRICRSIIDDHGGQIVAENNAAGGTTVSFSLKTWGERPG
jgi:two-component system, LuxR family, sensor kinase FixL